MTAVKICGITNLADARYAAGAGADFLGFIQHPASQRYVDPRLLKDLIAWIHGPKSVGVFVDVESDAVNRAADAAGFDFVQLHGNESPDACHHIERPVIKAIHVGGSGTSSAVTSDNLAATAARYDGAVSYLLLDTAVGAISGGSGTVFDWAVVSQLPVPFFVAGGLTPLNVAEAVQTLRPFGVDVSGGVEESPGLKDLELIDQFMDAVARTN